VVDGQLLQVAGADAQQGDRAGEAERAHRVTS
jgi:hypothetical protein